jgi:uncharacterized protein (DUF2062 family)
MPKFLNRRRLGIFRVAFAVEEGVAIGLAARQSVMPVVGLCIILAAMRIRLEALLS